MSKLRSLNTAFWSDTWIENLTPKEKLLFIYLITNEKTNMLGVYESSIKKISFETGLSIEEVTNALKGFETIGKVKYIKNHIVLVNYMKHQNYNTNMKKSAIDVYNNLPNELKDSKLNVSKDNPLKGFESLLNHFGMVRKIEVEDEVEYESEIEDEIKKIYEKFKQEVIDGKHNITIELWYSNLKLKEGKLTDLIQDFKTHLITEQILHHSTLEFRKHFKRWLDILNSKGLLDKYKRNN